jgi:GPH family glycoside/pentoside/hexuronide:cation symporter
MVADVCDFDELLTGTRREGMFGAIYWWMVKLGLAISSLLSGILLNVTGFNIALGANQTPQALLYMRFCDIGIPIVTSLAAIFIVMTFDISEAKACEIRAQVERRREERRVEERRVEEERRREERRDQG